MSPRELRLTIQAFLNTKHPRVYFQKAVAGAVFPYIVYDLPNAFETGEPPEVWVLDVDCWDNNPDTAALDALIESIDSELHRKTLVIGNARAQVYRDTRLAPITEDEPTLKRRRYTYQVRVYQ
jgi:hypothetical protein